MKKIIKVLTCLVLIIVLCLAFSNTAFAAGKSQSVGTVKKVSDITKTVKNKTVKSSKTAKKKAKSSYKSISKQVSTKKSTTYNKYRICKTTTTTVTTTKSFKKGSKKYTVQKKTVQKVRTQKYSVQGGEIMIQSISKNIPENVVSQFYNDGYKVVVDMACKSSGLFSSKDKQVTLRDSDNWEYVLSHEIGHYLAYVTGGTDNTDEWISIYQKEAGKYSGENPSYAVSTNKEFFASCYAEFILNNANLKATQPETYKYISEVYNSFSGE